MALKPITLKQNTFLEPEDVMEHLKIPAVKFGEYERRVTRLINMVTELMEKYIDGPILTRELVEHRDGDSSNTIVPDHWPVRGIKEIRISYLGQFDCPTSIIDPTYFDIRGCSDLQVGVRGTDICLRNDGNISIIGSLFLGSVVNSIQLTYRCGWGDTAEELPEDIKYAALMAIEYFYMVRENRELNLKSKNNMNQSYSRDTGLPKEVTDILDKYKDFSLGHINRPQKNTFTI